MFWSTSQSGQNLQQLFEAALSSSRFCGCDVSPTMSPNFAADWSNCVLLTGWSTKLQPHGSLWKSLEMLARGVSIHLD